MAANKTIGGINVTISATVDKFQKAMGLARKTLTGFVSAVNKTIFSMKGLAAALTGGLTIAGFAKLTANAMEQIDAQAKLADKLGITTTRLGGLQLAAAEAGVASNVLERSLVKLATDTGQRADRALFGVMEQAGKLGSETEILSLAVKRFGIRGGDMVHILKLGKDGLREAERAAISLGLALDRRTAAGVERANDSFGRFKFAVSGIFRSLAADIAPFIEVLSIKGVEFLSTNARGRGIGKVIADAIIAMTKFVVDAIQKMVVGVLEIVHDFKAEIHTFRANAPSWLGVGFPSAGSMDASSESITRARKRWLSARNKAPWSETIQRMVDESRASAAAAFPQRNGVARVFESLLSDARNRIGPSATNARQWGEKLWQGLATGIQSVPGLMLRGLWGASQFQDARQMRAERPALAFAESGSVESYRQQAAIRRQSENIQKKQLTTQERMLAKLDSIDRKTAVVMEAGLA